MTKAEILHPLGLSLGEGAVALGPDRFAFVDIRTGRVFGAGIDEEPEVLARADDTVGAVATTRSGDLLIAERRRLRLRDGDRELRLDIAVDVRTNDGRVDPLGRFLIGTMAEPVRAGAGDLWSCSGGAATAVISGVTISNGLCWSADGSTMYYIDTVTRAIDAFDYDVASGAVTERRRHVMVPEGAGDPDGLAIDADGGLWVALWGGSAVHCYRDRALVDRVELPTAYPTCPAFVGDRLVVTTAAEPAPGDDRAGHVYVADVDGGSMPISCVDEDLLFGARGDDDV